MKRPTLAIDFDGVVHAYRDGWQNGVIYDGLTDGCTEALIELSRRYRLVLFTARHNLDDVRVYLNGHHIGHLFDDVTNRKPAAVAYIDDRAVRFDSWDQVVGAL